MREEKKSKKEVFIDRAHLTHYYNKKKGRVCGLWGVFAFEAELPLKKNTHTHTPITGKCLPMDLTGKILMAKRLYDLPRRLFSQKSGPLAGVKIVEFAGIGPGPFAGMMLADMGADVVRVDRKEGVKQGRGGGATNKQWDVTLRGRKSIAVDLKHPDSHRLLLSLIHSSDGVIEGFRPGVMERLKLGPTECFAVNKKLVYGRITGWGQHGQLSQAAGHDINYIALSGTLNSFKRPHEALPLPPLNLVGDYGGGGMTLSFGMVCGLLQARATGKGDVVDASMVEGANSLMAFFYGLRAVNKAVHSDTSGKGGKRSSQDYPNPNPAGVPTSQLLFDDEEPGTHFLACGAHFYDVYRCADGKFITIASIEPQFYAKLLELLQLTNDPDMMPQMDSAKWPKAKSKLTNIFNSQPSAHWIKLMEGTDVCFAPVLTMQEAIRHQHNVDRKSFIEIDGITQPAPTPRFSNSPPGLPTPPPFPGQNSREILESWGMGLESSEIEQLLNSGVVVQA